MPWKETGVPGKREEFVLLASKEGSKLSALCQRFGISRETGYKWLRRCDGESAESLRDRPRRRLRSPRKSPAAEEEAVRSIRQAHPAWGGRKIARDRQLRVAPSTGHAHPASP